MLRWYNIYFESNPLTEVVLSKIKQSSGLELEFLSGNNSISLTHPTSSRHSIDLFFVKKGVYHGGEFIVERNHIRLDSSTPEMNYLEGVALVVLKNLGGEIQLAGQLPEWTSSKWMGEDWWKKVGSKPTFIGKLIEKLL